MAWADPYEQLIATIIQDAVDVFHGDAYASNVSTDFASPRLEALTFLHGECFEQYCEMLNLDSGYIRKAGEIPDPSDQCPCESCRLDYRPEAFILAGRRRHNGLSRFADGERHHVIYQKRRVHLVVPQLSEGQPADNYLKRRSSNVYSSSKR